MHLLFFANEILDEIASYVSSRCDQHSMLLSCRGLHWPAARQLYRDVSVSSHKARRLFKTITESKDGYETFIKTLKYKAYSNTDVHLTYIMLRDAIPKLQNLESLSLCMRPTFSPFLIYILKRSKVATFHGLPRLQAFQLHGDLRLMKLITYQRIQKLEVTEPMTNEEFIYLINTVISEESCKNLSITDLTLSFLKPRPIFIVKYLFSIGKSFPNLSRLSLRGLDLDALDISQVFTLDPPILPKLDVLEVNQISMTVRDEVKIQGGDLYDLQLNHIVAAGRLRPTLQRALFGDIGWERIPGSHTWDMLLQTQAVEDDPDSLPLNFCGRPCQWVLRYRKPMEISELKSMQLEETSDSESSL